MEGNPLLGSLLQHLLDQVDDFVGDLYGTNLVLLVVQPVGKVNEIARNLRDQLFGFAAVKGLLTEQHLVEDDAHRPDIALL